jgi:hypothetical protein
MTDIPENAARARQMYADGVTAREIIEETGLSHWMLYHWVDGGPKRDGKPLLPPFPRRRTVTRRRDLKETRLTLVNRMMRAAERQIGEIEQRLAGSGQAIGEQERDARTLALLAKTIQSLTALDVPHEKDAPKHKASKKNESIPRSIDELRRSVASKLAAIVAQRNFCRRWGLLIRQSWRPSTLLGMSSVIATNSRRLSATTASTGPPGFSSAGAARARRAPAPNG